MSEYCTCSAPTRQRVACMDTDAHVLDASHSLVRCCRAPLATELQRAEELVATNGMEDEDPMRDLLRDIKKAGVEEWPLEEVEFEGEQGEGELADVPIILLALKVTLAIFSQKISHWVLALDVFCGLFSAAANSAQKPSPATATARSSHLRHTMPKPRDGQRCASQAQDRAAHAGVPVCYLLGLIFKSHLQS